MHRRAFLAGASLLLPTVLRAQGAAGRVYRARLSTVPIDLTMAATVAGSGTARATLNGRTLVITGTFTGLRSAATVARLHRGPNRGLRGAPIADLTATAATSGDLTGSVELTAAQVDDLDKGRLYVQLHSEQAPDGNLWGWLLQETRSGGGR
ncbi:MAG: CHRD domain-containing protein [Acidobacteria bacterium]|nr:CHRD domain-containing protein [Acidobacteriota bacterium]